MRDEPPSLTEWVVGPILKLEGWVAKVLARLSVEWDRMQRERGVNPSG